jgi:hypothetical protein
MPRRRKPLNDDFFMDLPDRPNMYDIEATCVTDGRGWALTLSARTVADLVYRIDRAFGRNVYVRDVVFEAWDCHVKPVWKRGRDGQLMDRKGTKAFWERFPEGRYRTKPFVYNNRRDMAYHMERRSELN